MLDIPSQRKWMTISPVELAFRRATLVLCVDSMRTMRHPPTNIEDTFYL